MRPAAVAALALITALLAAGPVAGSVLPPGYRIEPFALGLESPGATALAPDGRVFYLERLTGSVRIVRNGRLLAEPFVTVPVSQEGEEGLLGIALHPDFAANGYVYLYYTQDSPRTNRIVRYTAAGDRGINPVAILDGLGAASNGEDNGGGLAFGADGKLYAGVGVLAEDSRAGDLGSLTGKVLRMNDDGSVPPDNPFVSTPGAEPLVWALGFRNPAALEVHPGAGTVYATDNYDDEAGAGCDEVDVVRRGLHYGWDGALNTCTVPGVPPAPMQDVVPPIETSGLASYGGSAFPPTCSNDPLRACASEEDCRTCDNRPDQACTADSDCKACSNDPERVCFSDDGSDCGTCRRDPSIRCVIDWQCGSNGPCEPHPCDANPCKAHACREAVGDLFIAGAASGSIVRDGLEAPGYDGLTSSSTFYDPSGSASCPGAIRSVRLGSDGWLYAASVDPDPAKRGLWRVVHDLPFGAGPAPREVSGSPYLRLTIERATGGAIKVSWEDLKRDAWGCTSGHCPGGSHESVYTVWSGPLASPFAYAHEAIAETAGQHESDALLSYTESTPPADSRYFLVSARGANLEGTVGRASDGSERPGFAKTDLCEAIGYGTPAADLDLCAGDWPHAYPDQNNRPRTLAEFRGKAVYLSLVSDT